ncbi:MAG: DivIVA domain-containing protein [Cytophagaceae bacterium]
MKITPLDIRKKEFEKAFRGYEKEEVDAFLLLLSQEWEKMIDENKELKRRLETSEKEVVRLREVENSLFKTIRNAEDTGAHVIDHANKTAELHLREAQMKAEAILNDANFRAKSIMEEAEEKTKLVVDSLFDDVKQAEREFNYIADQKENLLSELSGLVNETLERVNRYQAKGNLKETIQAKLKELRSFGSEKKALHTPPVNVAPKSEIPKPAARAEQPEVKPENKSSKDSGSFFDAI